MERHFDLHMMKQSLYDEYFPDRPTDVEEAGDANAEDTKKTEKFEPNYNNDKKTKNTSSV